MQQGYNIWFQSLETSATPLVAFLEEKRLITNGERPTGIRSVAQWMRDQFDGLMDRGAWIDEDTGKPMAPQAVCQRFVEKFGQVVG